MAPAPPRKSVPKDRFAALFSTLKTQTYHDPASRTPGSHTIRSIAWSPTGAYIATGSADRTLRIWNPEKPQVKNSTELRGHSAGIERVAWNPTKEAELASVSTDGTCRFWDVRSKSCVASVPLGGEGITIAWSGDGSIVIVGRRDDALIPISLPTYTAHAPLPQPLQTNQLTFTHAHPPTPRTLLLTHGDGTVKIADFHLPPQPPTSNPPPSKPHPPSTSPLPSTPLPPSPPPTLQTQHTLPAHTSSILSLSLSPSGRHLALGGSDALISLWDTTDWVCRHTLSSTVGAVRSVGFSFDGSYVAGGSDEGAGIEIAHVETGEVVCSIGTAAPAPCVAWHPGRYWVAYSGDAGGLKIVGAGGGVL